MSVKMSDPKTEEIKQLKAKVRKLTKALDNMTEQAMLFSCVLDLAMRRDESVNRGKKIAKLINGLDMVTSHHRHFDLHIPFEKDNRMRTNKLEKKAIEFLKDL